LAQADIIFDKNAPMKKEHILPLVIALLLLALGLLSLMLFFFKANPGLIRHKIKIGLIVISLQALMTGCGSVIQTGEEISCYAKPVEPDIMSLANAHYKNGKYIYAKGVDTIHVNVSDRSGNLFSFAILDTTGKVMGQGALLPEDGLLDKSWEELFVPLPAGLQAGSYQLVFYNCKIADIAAVENCRASYPISII
jgi:hypothetical protein